MKRFNSINSIALNELLKWYKSPKILMLFFFIITIIYQAAAPALQVSQQLGYRIAPWVYPMLFYHSYTQLVLSFSLILLFSNAPFIDVNQRYIMIRSGKRMWVNACMWYIILASAIFNIVVLLLSILSILPNTFLTLEWGKVITSIAYLPASAKTPFYVSKALITTYSPLEAVLHSLSLQFLLDIFLGEVMFIFNYLFYKPIGTIISVAVVLSRLMISDKWSFISPATIANLDMIDSLPYSYCFFLIAIGVLWAAAVRITSKSEVDRHV